MRRALATAVALAGAASTMYTLPAGAEPPDGVYDPHVEYWVTAPNDAGDVSVGDGVCRTSGGRCTLRAALQEAAVDRATSTIRFTCHVEHQEHDQDQHAAAQYPRPGGADDSRRRAAGRLHHQVPDDRAARTRVELDRQRA